MVGMEAGELLQNLRHPDESIRHKATLALGGTGRKDRAWVPDLVEALAHGSADIRFWAATGLGGIGPPAAEAAPALVGLLLDADEPANRQAAAGALAKIGAPAASEAIPALVQVLKEEDTVRYNAAVQLKTLGERAGDALPALRRLLERENEPEAVHSQASAAVESIERGAPVLRLDEPYHSISQAASRGRFADPSVADQARSRLDEDDFEGALKLLDDAIEGNQDSIVWLDLFNGARELDLQSQHRYYERYLQTSGLGGFWNELEGVVRSAREVQKGMRRMIRYCSSVEPDPRWKRFYRLGIADDLARLSRWLETAFTEDPPPDTIPGLWFGLVDVNRAREPSLDLRL